MTPGAPPVWRETEAGVVLSARGSRHAWSGVGALSIKSFRGGRARYVAGPGTFVVGDDAYLLLNEGQEYAIEIDAPEPVESLCVFFDSDTAADTLGGRSESTERLLDGPVGPRATPPLFFERTYPHDRFVSPVLDRLRAGVRSAEPSWVVERLHELLAALLRVHGDVEREARSLEAVRPATREELYRRLHRAREFLAASFPEPIGLRDAARVACLSPNHLLRTFPLLFGCTPHAWLTRRRIGAAREMLAGDGRSVIEVCQAVGFESPASFTRLFRRHVGVTPGAFRRLARQKGDSGQVAAPRLP